MSPVNVVGANHSDLKGIHSIYGCLCVNHLFIHHQALPIRCRMQVILGSVSKNLLLCLTSAVGYIQIPPEVKKKTCNCIIPATWPFHEREVEESCWQFEGTILPPIHHEMNTTHPLAQYNHTSLCSIAKIPLNWSRFKLQGLFYSSTTNPIPMKSVQTGSKPVWAKPLISLVIKWGLAS